MNENLYNPIPLHLTKDNWYDNRPTYHGACNHPIVPIRKILPMSATFRNGELQDEAVFNITMLGGSASSVIGLRGIPLFKDNKVEFTSGLQTLSVEKRTDGRYDVELKATDISTHTTRFFYFGEQDDDEPNGLTESTLRKKDAYVKYYYNTVSGREFNYARFTDKVLCIEKTVSIAVYELGNNSELYTKDILADFDFAEEGMVTDDRYMAFLTGSIDTDVEEEGVYYLVADVEGLKMYSEPFTLLNTTDIIHLAYSNSRYIYTKNSFVPFAGKQMEMYVRSTMMMPPYKFDSVVEDLDGHKFVQKLVSYRDDKFTFLCTQYFAEAIRMLWHCNDVYVNGRKVDYMEPPQIEWNDNHLCTVTIELQSDTIVQTNGEAQFIES